MNKDKLLIEKPINKTYRIIRILRNKQRKPQRKANKKPQPKANKKN
jgi:hypothetical protein